MDQLEAAVRRGGRVALRRRGGDYVVIALRIQSAGRHDVLVGRLPMTGEELEFPLEQLEWFQAL